MCVVCGRADGTETDVHFGENSGSAVVVVCEDCRADGRTPPATVTEAGDAIKRPPSVLPEALWRRPSPVCECRDCGKLYNTSVNGDCPFC